MMVTEQRPISVGWLGVTAGYPSRALLNRAQCVTVAPGIAVCVVLRSTAALDEPTIIAPAACHDHFSNAETRGPSIQDHHGARQFVGSVKAGVVEAAYGYASRTSVRHRQPNAEREQDKK
jgi:hypothetical protein